MMKGRPSELHPSSFRLHPFYLSRQSLNCSQTCGPKTRRPMATEPAAVMSTAPAATSLALAASGWKAGEATSVRNSKAVLSASAVQTAMTARMTQHHSSRPSRKWSPAVSTAAVAAACTHALCCEATITRTPLSAQRTLRIRPVNVKPESSFIEPPQSLCDARPRDDDTRRAGRGKRPTPRVARRAASVLDSSLGYVWEGKRRPQQQPRASQDNPADNSSRGDSRVPTTEVRPENYEQSLLRNP